MPESPSSAPNPDQNAASTDHRAPARLVHVLSAALLAEAAIFAVAAVVLVVGLFGSAGSGDGVGRGPAIGMTAFLVVCALGLAAALFGAARALRRGRQAARAVAMTWQIFQIVLGVTALMSQSVLSVVIGVVLLVLALAVALLLLMPRVVEATTQG